MKYASRAVRVCLALPLLLALLLTGCGLTQLNATGYVQGLLDETYKGTWEESYLALVDLTEEEAAADYQAGLEAELTRFSDYFRLEADSLSQQTLDAFREYLGQLYARARYSVDCATRSESGAWLVEVTVQPILTLAALTDQAADLRAAFDADPLLPEENREETWASLVLEACRSAEVEYGEKTTITVRLTADEEGFYSIGALDFYHLDELILSYEQRT